MAWAREPRRRVKAGAQQEQEGGHRKEHLPSSLTLELARYSIEVAGFTCEGSSHPAKTFPVPPSTPTVGLGSCSPAAAAAAPGPAGSPHGSSLAQYTHSQRGKASVPSVRPQTVCGHSCLPAVEPQLSNRSLALLCYDVTWALHRT